MFHILKNYIDRNFNLLSFITVFFCFVPLFYFSTNYVLNGWAYSDALINYSEGFIRRGLLGEIIFNINNFTNLGIQKIHAYIFIFFTLINIFFYILILRNISKFRFVYIFLLFNPLLLFFPLNDTGGYLRKEILMLTLMFFHCYLCNKYHSDKLSLSKYFLIFKCFIIPGIILNTLMHDIQLFLIPFHFILTLNVIDRDFKLLSYKNNFNKKNLNLLFYIFTTIPFFIFIFFPASPEKINLIIKNVLLADPHAFSAPIKHVADPFLGAAQNNTMFMFSKDDLGTYNHIFKYFFLLVFSIGTIYLIFNKVLNKNVLIFNHWLVFVSIVPLFLLFFIGRDWGRWIHLISFAYLLFYMQFNFSKIKKKYQLIKNKYLNLILILTCFGFLSVISLPHCCKQQTIFDGFYKNILLSYNLFINNSKYIDETFREIN
tara:strand:- start:1467 stop:2756 length:1290 start_codon:yes stop_codon:yes gene_type:complete